MYELINGKIEPMEHSETEGSVNVEFTVRDSETGESVTFSGTLIATRTPPKQG